MQARCSGHPDMRQRSASRSRRAADRVPIELCSPARAAPLRAPDHLLMRAALLCWPMERTTYYILYILEWTHLAFTSTVALIKIWVKLQYSAKCQNKMVYCSYYLVALIIVNHWEYYHSIMKTTLSYYKNAHKLIRNSNCVSNFNWGCFMLFIFNDVNTLTLIHNNCE